MDVTVRDPVVVSAAIPRFLNAGDASRLRVDIDNVEGPAGEYAVEASAEGPVSLPASPRGVRLEAGGKAAIDLPLSAGTPGDARIELRLTGPGLGAPLSQRLALRVRPAADATVRRSVQTIQPGGTLALSGDLLADMVPGTGAVTVSDASLPGLDAPGLLRALERYPYECTEQTVSRALPLLNVGRLAPEAELGAGERVRAAIERVLSRQDAGGDFGLWSASGTGDAWLVAYVADFLTRARERGHAVPQGAFNLALDRLRNTVANNPDVTGGGADLAYAAYVLARNGRPVMGDLRYLADTKLAAFTTPLARGQVAAALALLGDKARAAKAFEAAAAALRAERDKGEYRADYGSRLRDGAGLVALAAESGIAGATSAGVASVLAEESAMGRATSTQEDAWMLLAAEASAGPASPSAVAVDGEVPSGRLHRAFPSARLAGGPVVLSNRGVTPVQVSVGVSGNPTAPEPAESRGYAVERSYHRLDGSPADLGQVRQNDRLVVVVKVTERKAQAARILVVDRLPAGFEIDNPKLLDADAVPALPWLRSDIQPTHVEFRDDRFAASFDRDPAQGAFLAVAYVVRAVTPGRYAHPAASVEDMYRPDRHGRTAFGTLEVGPAR